MNSKKVFLLLNGNPPKTLPNLSNYDFVCAIDGGYNFFKEKNIVPDLITGDFDSIESIPETIETIHTWDQNFTDFHKTLQILLNKGFLHIDVFGGSGKEVDHFMGNIHTALTWKEKLKLTFFDDYGKYFFIDSPFSTSKVQEKIISLIPFPTANNITTKGLRYPLTNENLDFGNRIGTRNTAVENDIEITFEQGNLLIYISNK